MDQLSQKRRWVAQDQAIAEVAAACGVSGRAIGRLLGFNSETVREKLALWLGSCRWRSGDEILGGLSWGGGYFDKLQR
jgi:hypothetical protein